MQIKEILIDCRDSFSSANQNLAEAFDSAAQSKIVVQNSEQFTTSAQIGNRTIIFEALNDGKNDWYITFVEKRPKNSDRSTWMDKSSSTTDREPQGTYLATGSGNQMQVFSFVIQSIRTLCSLYHPIRLEFASMKRGNRADLYAKIISRVQIPGYKLNADATHENNDKKIFVIDRVDDHA